MQPLESLDAVKNMLAALMTREEPLVRELPPSPGSRAERFVQLLCPDLHPLDMPSSDVASGSSGSGSSPGPSGGLTARVDALQLEVAMLKDALRKLAASIGEPDPLPSSSGETVAGGFELSCRGGPRVRPVRW